MYQLLNFFDINFFAYSFTVRSKGLIKACHVCRNICSQYFVTFEKIHYFGGFLSSKNIYDYKNILVRNVLRRTNFIDVRYDDSVKQLELFVCV